MKEQQTKYVIAQIGREEYGLSIENVLSVEKIPEITKIPQSPHYIIGVINYRERIIPIVNVSDFLYINEENDNDEHKLLIIQKNEQMVGLKVDNAKDIIDIPQDSIEEIALQGDFGHKTLVANLKERLIILLNTADFFDNEELLKVIEKMKKE